MHTFAPHNMRRFRNVEIKDFLAELQKIIAKDDADTID